VVLRHALNAHYAVTGACLTGYWVLVYTPETMGRIFTALSLLGSVWIWAHLGGAAFSDARRSFLVSVLSGCAALCILSPFPFLAVFGSFLAVVAAYFLRHLVANWELSEAANLGWATLSYIFLNVVIALALIPMGLSAFSHAMDADYRQSGLFNFFSQVEYAPLPPLLEAFGWRWLVAGAAGFVTALAAGVFCFLKPRSSRVGAFAVFPLLATLTLPTFPDVSLTLVRAILAGLFLLFMAYFSGFKKEEWSVSALLFGGLSLVFSLGPPTQHGTGVVYAGSLLPFFAEFLVMGAVLTALYFGPIRALHNRDGGTSG